MKKNSDAKKTNAVRLLDAAGIVYSIREYGDDDTFHTGTDVARLIGADF